MNAALKAVPRPDELVTGYLRALLAEKQADWPINPGEYENDLQLFKQGLDGIPSQQRTRDIIFAMLNNYPHLFSLVSDNSARTQQILPPARSEQIQEEDARLTIGKAGKKVFKTLSMSEIKKKLRPESLIPGILHRVGSSIIFGAPGTSKTFLALDIAFHLGYGMTWQGRQLPQSRVLYVYGEGNAGLINRIEGWQKYHNQPDTENVQFICAPVQLMTERNILCATIEEQEEIPAFIVLDTFSVCAEGIDENDNSKVAQFIAAANYIAETYQTHVCIIHHTNKSGEYRGAVAFKGNVSTMISLNREDRDAPVVMHCEKQKDAEEFADIRLQLKQVDICFDDDALETVTSCVVVAADESQYGASQTNKKEQTTMLEVLTTYGRLTGNRWAAKCKELGVSARAFKDNAKILREAKRVTWEKPVKKGVSGYYSISASEEIEQFLAEQGEKK